MTTVVPVSTSNYIAKNFSSPVLVLSTEEGIEQNELKDAIDDEQHLHYQICYRYVSANQAWRPSKNTKHILTMHKTETIISYIHNKLNLQVLAASF